MSTQDTNALQSVKSLIHTRQNVSPKRLVEPGPSPAQLQDILNAAGAAPDHGQIRPWRFVIVPQNMRHHLGHAFWQALMYRDANASPEEQARAREKANRAPLLIVAIARLCAPHPLASTTACAPAHRSEVRPEDVSDAERLVSLGCAIQNILLMVQAAGFGSGLTSGLALASVHVRKLLALQPQEQAVCCINIGTVDKRKPHRVRPAAGTYVSVLATPDAP